MALDLVLSGARLVLPGETLKSDLGIADGRIAAMGDLSTDEADLRLDCSGLSILPGAIDTQVHFREPGLEQKEDIESGTRAAVCGGVTTVFEMPNTKPPTTSPEALADKLQRARGRSWCDIGFFVGASEENADRLADYEMLPGTPGIKIFMGSSTGSLLVEKDEVLRQVLRNGVRPCPVHSEDEARLRERDALLSSRPHPREHPHLRDAEAALLSTRRLLALCEETGRPVHILHVSTLDELPLIAEAKRKGLPVSCEATPQHVTLDASMYEALGTLLQMNPPVRSREHREALFAALQEGLFDVVGSDHAPHTLEEKARPYPLSPSGMPGVQTLLPILLDWASKGAWSLQQIADWTCHGPARLYGIRDKGLVLGADADLAVVDPSRKWTVSKEWLQSKCGWSPYEGWTLTGSIEHVLLGGSLQVKEGRLTGSPERGRAPRFSWKG